MYKLKYANVRRVVSTEAERDKLIQEGYSLYGEEVEEEAIKDIQEPAVEETEEPKEDKKGRGRNGK